MIYHMNKTNWITILLNDAVPDEQNTPLLELSYDSVTPRRRGRKQPSIQAKEEADNA